MQNLQFMQQEKRGITAPSPLVYPNGVIWINADQDIEAQLAELADRAIWVAPDSEHRYKLDVARHRLKTYSDCLIVFDNLEDISAIEGYLPEPQADPHILVTSRTEQPGFTPFPLELLDEDLSLELLTQEAGRKPEGDVEEDAVWRIVEALGGLPLALELAGGYLRHRQSVSWQRYHELLDRNLKSAMPGRFLSGSFTQHEADIYSTLKLNEDFFVDEPHLKDVVDLLTWSGPASMGISLMCGLLAIDDETTLTNALALGVELRLLQMTPAGERYALHRLVREVRREDIPLDERAEWVITICQHASGWFQERRREFTDLPLFESEIDHLRTWQEHAMKFSPEEVCRLTWLQAYPPFHQGRYREVKEWLERSLDSLEKLGLIDEELEAHLYHDLGTTYSHLGEYKRALMYQEKALGIRMSLLGERHPDTAMSLGSLGTSYINLENYNRAEECQEKALEILRELFGEKHPDSAMWLGSLGSVYGFQGDHKRALEYQEKALEILQELYGEKHPEPAKWLSSIGVTHGELGDKKLALDHLSKALEIVREMYGEKHPDTARSLSNLGKIYEEIGDHQLALKNVMQALQVYKELFGEEHPDTVNAALDLAIIYTNSGNWPSALNVLEALLSKLPRENSAYKRLTQRKLEILRLSGRGFRQQSKNNQRPRRNNRL